MGKTLPQGSKTDKRVTDKTILGYKTLKNNNNNNISTKIECSHHNSSSKALYMGNNR